MNRMDEETAEHWTCTPSCSVYPHHPAILTNHFGLGKCCMKLYEAGGAPHTTLSTELARRSQKTHCQGTTLFSFSEDSFIVKRACVCMCVCTKTMLDSTPCNAEHD